MKVTLQQVHAQHPADALLSLYHMLLHRPVTTLCTTTQHGRVSAVAIVQWVLRPWGSECCGHGAVSAEAMVQWVLCSDHGAEAEVTQQSHDQGQSNN